MKYRIEFSNQADKFLNKLSDAQYLRIASKINALPKGSDIKKMKGFKSRYRLRVGDFRIIYEIENDILLILILEIGGRGDIYK